MVNTKQAGKDLFITKKEITISVKEEQIYYIKKLTRIRKGYYKKQYRSSSLDCRNCPLRKLCIGRTTDYKKIEDTIDKQLYDQMHQRLQSPYARAMKKRRQSTVEPVLGTLINFMSLRRIWTRAIKAANKFMLGAAIAYNLKQWLNYTERKVNIAVMAMKTTREGLYVYFFATTPLTHRYNRKSSYLFLIEKGKTAVRKSAAINFKRQLCNRHQCWLQLFFHAIKQYHILMQLSIMISGDSF